MNIKDNFKKSSVEMMLLKFLSDQDLYGYEMVTVVISANLLWYFLLPELLFPRTLILPPSCIIY